MNDILPSETPVWQFLESTVQRVLRRYSYNEIRFPVLEQTQLFKRSIGEVTDIVEKEMYSFPDRNGENLSLRPEGTAGCVRAANEHGLLYNQQQRLWYKGPMFRYERPQKGRYRQFHQIGIETFGMNGPDIDVEVILLSARLWAELGLAPHVRLEINNIGNSQDRRTYGDALVAFLQQHEADLDEDSRRRLSSNPLRILDSKVPATQAILVDAPVLSDFVSEESQAHFDQIKAMLADAGIAFTENPRLVRGLDYYNNMVFEWITDSLGAQGTVCAGGRYDGLVQQLGGKPTPAVGCAMGVERLVLMLQELVELPTNVSKPVDVCVLAPEQLSAKALILTETLRNELPNICFQTNCGGGKISSQLKRAYNSGASAVVILETSRDEATAGELVLKLRALDDANAQQVSEAELAQSVAKLLAGSLTALGRAHV